MKHGQKIIDDNLQYSSVPPSDNEGSEQADTTQTNASSHPSLTQELCKVSSSISPNDFLVSLSFFLAALYVSNLREYAENDDGAELALITVVAHACIRVIAQGFALPAGFAHIGLSFNNQTHNLEEDKINQQQFTNSIAAMIKACVLSSIPAATFLAITPLFYQLAGTSKPLINDSYLYIPLGCASLVFQNCNTGFQQTMLKLGKKNRMLRTAAVTGVFTTLPVLLLLLFDNPLTKSSPLTVLGSILLIGSSLVTLNHAVYLHKKGYLPSISTYLNPENTKDISDVFTVFRIVGFNIFLQLVSELLAVYIQPFIARLFFANEQLGSLLALLNGAGNLNLFTIIFAITGSQAVSNALDTIVRHIRENTAHETSYNDIRKIILTSFMGMFLFSAILNVALMTAIAPTIAGLFYNTNDIDIPSPSNNPYMVIAFIGIGTTIDYLRNLALFVLRSFGVNDYGTFASYVCLWILNPVLIAGMSQIKDIGVFGILAPYYISLSVGTILLWKRVYECTHDNAKLQALINSQNPNHEKVNTEAQRCLPKCWSEKSSSVLYREGDTSAAIPLLTDASDEENAQTQVAAQKTTKRNMCRIL